MPNPTKEERQEEISNYCDSSEFPAKVESAIAQSKEQKILPRLDFLEELNGASVEKHVVGTDWDWEEMSAREQMLYPERKKISVEAVPVQIKMIDKRLKTIEGNGCLPITRGQIPPPRDVKDIRADFITEYIKNNSRLVMPNGFANVELKVVDTYEFKIFMKTVIPEEYRSRGTTKDGWRKLKKDVFEAVERRYGHEGFYVDKSENGHHELRLAYERQFTEAEEDALLQRLGYQVETPETCCA